MYVGKLHKSDTAWAQFLRNKQGDFLLIQYGRESISVPVPIIEAAMADQWDADSIDRAARRHVEGGSDERFDVT